MRPSYNKAYQIQAGVIMSATLNKEEINCAKSVYNFNESIKVECKIDGLEECEILSAIPRLTTPKSETADGSIKVYGKVTYFVAYKKDGCIKRAETSAEYSFTLKNDNVKSDQTATVTATVLKTEEYYSSNTLLLTTTIELNCDLKKSCRVAFVSQGQDVILKTEMTPVAKSFGKKQNKLTITEEFELPKLIDEVIYHTESAFVTDCKAGIGSILVDVECVITSYILQKNANSDIVKESHTFPFRLEIDEEHAMPTMQAIATASVEDATVTINSYEETGLSKVKAEIVLLLEGETFDLTETPIAVDAYSTTHPAGFLRHGVKTQIRKPLQGLSGAVVLQGGTDKFRIIAVVAALQGMGIGQIAAAVAGGAQLPAHPGLPLQQHHLNAGMLRSSQGRRHAGCTGTDNSDHHSMFLT